MVCISMHVGCYEGMVRCINLQHEVGSILGDVFKQLTLYSLIKTLESLKTRKR